MPLFNKKFDPKSIPPRGGRCNIGCPTVNEELDEYKNVSLCLGNKELRFADGIWLHTTRKSDVDDVIRMNRRIKSLEEQNNMCNLKVEVLLDLLAENAMERNVLSVKEKVRST